jgi:TolA-binding protein
METKVMKITWTIAALAGSVTLVNAQQSPRRVPPTPPATPAPASPRAERPEPAVAPGGLTPLPGIDWLLDPPGAMTLLAPGQNTITPFPPLPWLPALEPLTAIAPMAIEFPTLPPLPPLPAQSPLAIDVPMAIDMPMLTVPPTPVEPMVWDLLQGQGPTTPRPPAQDRALEAELRRLTMELDRADAARQRALDADLRNAARQAEVQDRAVQRELEAALRSLEAQDRAMTRENERITQQMIRSIEAQERVMTREAEQAVRSAQALAQGHASSATQLAHAAEAYLSLSHNLGTTVKAPAPWASQDVADSAYRVARELFNRGEYGQAVQAFRSLPTRYPNSVYAPDAAYYQAFSLFRIGGTTELREALAALEASKVKYPNARSKTEATNLATRIRGVLAQRGDAQAAAELARTANEQGVTCDREEQAVQAEAMNALSRSDAGNVNDLITRVLARKDECAIPLRRTAVFLVGNRRDAQAVTILSGVARNDPSVDVRVEAIGIIGRLPNEEGVTVLEELTRSDDERIQRAAIRSLVRHPSARARTSVRGLVERDDVSERVRSEALSAFDSERATADDVAWLRALYAKVTTSSLKARTLSAIVRVGGPEVDQWLVTIARDDNQPSEIRATAMRRIGATLPIADLGRLYDTATQQRFRSEIIGVLGKRKEEAATDKLIDIIKNGTDPSLRRSAISAVVNKNDPKATALLLEIINK